MDITHLGHACLLIETGNARILVDPGTLADRFDDVRGLDAVLVTHEHADHFDTARAATLMAANAEAEIIVHAGMADLVADAVDPSRARTITAGETFAVKDVEITGVGGVHATIHPDIPNTGNLGFFFPESGLLHPGDALGPTDLDVRVLALPISGPWLSLEDSVDFMRAIAAPVVFPMHEAALTEPEVWNDFIGGLAPESTKYRILDPGKPGSF